MAILHIGHEAGFVTTAASTKYSTNSAYFDSDFSRCAVLGGHAGRISIPFAETAINTTTGLWLHFSMLVPSSVSSFTSANWFTLYDAAEATLFRVARSGSPIIIYNAASQAMATSPPFTWTNLLRYDIWIRESGGNTKITIWTDEVKLVEATITGTLTAAKRFEIGAYTWSSGDIYASHVSEIVVATEPTLGARVFSKAPVGAGTYTDWTGDYTAVDEVTPDAAYMTSSTAEEKATYTFSALGDALGDRIVKAVALGGLVQAETGLKRLVRSGGVDDSALLSGVESTFSPNVSIMAVNPVTSAVWTPTDISSVEFGYESV